MKPAQFSLENILTLDCSLRRDEILPEDYEQNIPELAIQISWGREDDMFRIYLTTDLKQVNNEKTYVEGKVAMVGYFKKSGELPDSVLQSFCEINAPAILFPFVREAFASLSLKSGLRPILLQPINFVEVDKETSIEDRIDSKVD